jgi:antitoxin component of MazEF toxin-antitoxin module
MSLRTLISTMRVQGASIVTTLPAEVVRRLGLSAGQELAWIEDGLGGFRVVPSSQETAAALEAHERIMAEYDPAFRVLAR